MMKDFQAIYKTNSESINAQAKATEKIADAMLIMARTQEELTSIIKKMASSEVEGIHVKRMAD